MTVDNILAMINEILVEVIEDISLNLDIRWLGIGNVSSNPTLR